MRTENSRVYSYNGVEGDPESDYKCVLVLAVVSFHWGMYSYER